jgi:hypothetical protein
VVVRTAAVNKTYFAVGISNLLAVVACGGTSDVERKAPPVQEVGDGVDFYDCVSVTAKYEFQSLSDGSNFDRGSNIRGSGPPYYYSNNDKSNPARQLTPDEVAQKVERPPCDCEPDQESAPEDGAVIQPVVGGAPSLSEESLCSPSPRSVQLVSRGKGFTGWGMVFGGSYDQADEDTDDPDDLKGVDASLWDGVALWVKRDSDAPLSMFASVVDRYTVSKGLYCQDEGLLENSCDAFGIGAGFEPEWRLVLLPFDAASQRGFGKGSPNQRVEADDLWGFSFYLPSGAWDVRVDELSFYRRK